MEKHNKPALGATVCTGHVLIYYLIYSLTLQTDPEGDLHL